MKKLLINIVCLFIPFKKSRHALREKLVIPDSVRYSCRIAKYLELVGRGVKFPHPVGIVISEHAKIGRGSVIYQNATIGTGGAGDDGYPTVEENVNVFAGAVIVGAVRIGKNSIIGANAVVISDIPPNSVAVGAPARVVRTLV